MPILLGMETESSTDLNVFVAEDSPALRQRIVASLREIPSVSIVGQAASARGAIDGILSTAPRCVVLDFTLEEGTALDVLRQARSALPGSLFIVLTNYPYPQYRIQCEALGADHFFDKSAEFERATACVAALAARSSPALSGQI